MAAHGCGASACQRVDRRVSHVASTHLAVRAARDSARRLGWVAAQPYGTAPAASGGGYACTAVINSAAPLIQGAGRTRCWGCYLPLCRTAGDLSRREGGWRR